MDPFIAQINALFDAYGKAGAAAILFGAGLLVWFNVFKTSRSQDTREKSLSERDKSSDDLVAKVNSTQLELIQVQREQIGMMKDVWQQSHMDLMLHRELMATMNNNIEVGHKEIVTTIGKVANEATEKIILQIVTSKQEVLKAVGAEEMT